MVRFLGRGTDAAVHHKLAAKPIKKPRDASAYNARLKLGCSFMVLGPFGKVRVPCEANRN